MAHEKLWKKNEISCLSEKYISVILEIKVPLIILNCQILCQCYPNLLFCHVFLHNPALASETTKNTEINISVIKKGVPVKRYILQSLTALQNSTPIYLMTQLKYCCLEKDCSGSRKIFSCLKAVIAKLSCASYRQQFCCSLEFKRAINLKFNTSEKSDCVYHSVSWKMWK